MDGSILLAPGFDAWVWPAVEPRLSTARSMKGFEREFEDFFTSNYDAVVAALTAITGDRERAVDATQEAFIKAYARWSKIRGYDLPEAWVRRIAINASRDSIRSERRRRRRELPHLAAPSTMPADRIVGDDFARGLLAALPRRQREVAALYYLDDRSVGEISSILGVSGGTVKSQLAEARTRLRATLDAEAVDS